MTRSINCPSCDAEIAFEFEGENIAASWDGPAEYVTVNIISRECELEGEDACDATDAQIEREAFAQCEGE